MGPQQDGNFRRRVVPWVALLWFAPVWVVLILALHPSARAEVALVICGFGVAPLPALLSSRRREARWRSEAESRREACEQLKLQLETVRGRTAQLRAELSAADQQARLSHQLTLLGQFTAGFLHEFNNPLAILTNRIEILLEERRDDPALCADLEQLLKEARYMGKIAGTLLPALRRQRGEDIFNPSIPAEALAEVTASLEPAAARQGIRLTLETAETPQVNLPSHVVSEVTRALVTNAIEALARGSTIWVRLERYHAAGAKVVLRVEDNGPGVPEDLCAHLFEPFVSRSASRERLGLGLFLAASLLDTYDGSLRYERREGGGAAFIVEMPPARFTKEQPYHWFLKGVSE